MILETESLILRPWEERDTDLLHCQNRKQKNTPIC